MGMKTQIKKVGDTTVVSIDGKLDFEVQDTVRSDLAKLMGNTKRDELPKKVIFNLENLEFVGSSGISSFVAALREFNSRAEVKPRYCNVRSEFRRVMNAFDGGENFEFYETEDRARKSFDQ